MKNIWFQIAVMALLLFGCSKEESPKLPDLKPIELPTNIDGLYSGRLPCESCKARMVRITFEKDSTLNVVQTLVTDSMVVDTLKGNYSFDGEYVTLLFDNQKYKLKKDASGNLSLMTSAGTIYEDSDAMKMDLIRIFNSKKVSNELKIDSVEGK